MVRNSTGGWDAKKEKSERSSGHFNTQREAELEAKQFAANNGGGEVKIHGLNGQIRDSDTVSPGHDPNPPEDKKH
ncbi:MAG: DUF2188 domain-containing protein [Patescibacteria group bacterium]